jgi:sRNA-binding protein
MDRDDVERGIEALSEAYPKTFFVPGRMRRPLKKGIAADLKAKLKENPGDELNFYDIDATLDWYCAHVGYVKNSSVAGTPRIDLNGKAVGTITESEARIAGQTADEIFERIEETKKRYVSNDKGTVSGRGVASPAVKVLKVNVSATDDELLASMEKHLGALRTMLTTMPDDLKEGLARPILILLIDELKTLEARITV